MAAERFVMSARIVGGVRRDEPKLKTYMVSVLWSDQAEVIIYRSFRDFKNFHGQLKKKFPTMNSLQKDERVIPKFRGGAIKSSLNKTGPKKDILRMKFLESYCDKLLKCSDSVIQSTEVVQFFLPKDHDLQPEFTKNTVMILMSDDLPDGPEKRSASFTHHPTGVITKPFVTQTYQCLAAYETKDTKNRPFKVAVNEKLDVLIKDPAGWWLVENEEKRLAWFPAPFLELSEEEDENDYECLSEGSLYCAVRSYSTTKDDEISVTIGTVVEVLRKSDNGWWLIRCNGKAGYIPTMYLQPYNNPRVAIYSLQRRLHGSSLNLASSRSSQISHQPSINRAQQDSPGPSSYEPRGPRRLHKTRSLDVLSDSWVQTQAEEGASADSRLRSMSNISHESTFSSFSSGSESSSSLKEDPQGDADHPQQSDASDSPQSSPDLSHVDRKRSSKSSRSSGSASSKGSEVASVTPKVPPRPKTEEILNRCTTMTRKAALSTKTRLQAQSLSIHSR
ncbi:NADPH oxidase organizer 1-like [Mugil cephalus]|uniref:NADPH oxidase organizer 1-like n=1 Tax=Mugil cephalus TaxID=48193 RepID=UPI001FB6FB59|nr:NADPH oxidase organizer 1-like [Mugil cephalus]